MGLLGFAGYAHAHDIVSAVDEWNTCRERRWKNTDAGRLDYSKTYVHYAILSTTNPTWTGLVSNPDPLHIHGTIML